MGKRCRDMKRGSGQVRAKPGVDTPQGVFLAMAYWTGTFLGVDYHAAPHWDWNNFKRMLTRCMDVGGGNVHGHEVLALWLGGILPRRLASARMRNKRVLGQVAKGMVAA
eukprot:jgi/Tetstr1/425970/TSEL_016320.t1